MEGPGVLHQEGQVLKGIEVPPPPALSMTSPRTQALLILDHPALQALLGAQDDPKPDSGGTSSGKTATVVLSVRRKPLQPISAEQLLVLHKTRPNGKPSVSISTTMH